MNEVPEKEVSRKTTQEKEAHLTTNESGLSYLISLPKTPTGVKWQKPDPNNRENGHLVALLEFNQADYDYIVANSSNFERIQDARIPKALFTRWIDVPIASRLTIEESANVYTLKGVNALKPNLFTQNETSPFIHGSIIPLGSRTIFIVLSSM